MYQCVDCIEQLETGQAGKLLPYEEETTAAIRRRLDAATQLLGMSLVVNNFMDAFFLLQEGSSLALRRRGRQRKYNAETEPDHAVAGAQE